MYKRKRENSTNSWQLTKRPPVTLPSPVWDIRIKAGKGNLFFSHLLLWQVAPAASPFWTPAASLTEKVLEWPLSFDQAKLFLSYLLNPQEAKDNPSYPWENLFESATSLGCILLREQILTHVWSLSPSIRSIYLFFHFKRQLEETYGPDQLKRKEDKFTQAVISLFYPNPLVQTPRGFELGQLKKTLCLPPTEEGKRTKAFLLTHLLFGTAYLSRSCTTVYT